MLSFEFFDEMVYKTVVEVLVPEMGAIGGGLDFEGALLDGEEGNGIDRVC
jgi:hypothetical protein